MLLLRGATRGGGRYLILDWFQYMLLLRGATMGYVSLVQNARFQYMLLLRGATGSCAQPCGSRSAFQYMLLLRGATRSRKRSGNGFLVSIHAPLARSNPNLDAITEAILGGFNTCSSCEEQPHCLFRLKRGGCFNTCSSCEEQLPITSRRIITRFLFQYMLLLRGATPRKSRLGSQAVCFNTCSSCEEQLRHPATCILCWMFQYMLLLRGATSLRARFVAW